MTLGLDSPKADRISLYVMQNGLAALRIADDNSRQRAALGILSPKGNSGLVLNDSNETIRSLLSVDADGVPKLEVFDDKGRPIFTAPIGRNKENSGPNMFAAKSSFGKSKE